MGFVSPGSMRMNVPRHIGLILLVSGVVLAAAAAGCKSGPAVGEVHGKVTFKGNPVKGGKIAFYNPTTGDPAEADLQTNGTYVISAPVPVGDYIVWISPPLHWEDNEPGKTPAAWVEKAAPDIPTKYRGQASTPLKTTIKQGKNEANFDMVP